MSAATPLVPRKRRGAELFLLVLAVLIGIGAYISVALGATDRVPAGTVRLVSILILIAAATHTAVRKLAPYADPVLVPLVIALNGIGLAMIHRIDLATGKSLANQQFIWTVIGLIGFIAILAFVRDHRRLQISPYTIGLVALALLALPLLPGIGKEINGSRIWIGIGPLSFQPGEIAKILLAVSFAGYLVRHRDALALAGRRILGIDLPRGRDLGPIAVAWLGSLAILVLQRDLGSSLLFFGLFVVMLYISTERPGWLVVGSGLFFSGAYFSYLLFSHVQLRVSGWLDPFGDTDRNYQLISGMFGMAHGGIIGRGLGLGSPQITPYSYSDFIATSIGEELGLTGLMAILLMYALIVERGLRIALTCRDGFGKLLAAGLAVSMAIQIFVVVGGVTRLIPLTGLTTPFLSYGGSSILANWAIIALLLRISDQTRRPAPSVAAFELDEATQVVKAV